MSLELKRVEKKVGQDTHIYRTDLTFQKNTTNILLGSTLAGKTTLMQIMAGLDKPTNGEIILRQSITTSALQGAFAFQSELSALDNIYQFCAIKGLNPV